MENQTDLLVAPKKRIRYVAAPDELDMYLARNLRAGTVFREIADAREEGGRKWGGVGRSVARGDSRPRPSSCRECQVECVHVDNDQRRESAGANVGVEEHARAFPHTSIWTLETRQRRHAGRHDDRSLVTVQVESSARAPRLELRRAQESIRPAFRLCSRDHAPALLCNLSGDAREAEQWRQLERNFQFSVTRESNFARTKPDEVRELITGGVER